VLVEVLRHFIDENRHPITGVAHRLGLSYSTLRKVLDREQAPKAGLMSEPR
jgi:predicted transcriptional regulator